MNYWDVTDSKKNLNPKTIIMHKYNSKANNIMYEQIQDWITNNKYSKNHPFSCITLYTVVFITPFNETEHLGLFVYST